jgi:hypothetical protein
VIIAARDEKVSLIIFVDTIDVKEIPGIIIRVSMTFSGSISLFETIMF